MTKNEALKAAIDGKKIVHPSFCDDSYVYFNGRQFMRSCINPKDDFAIGDSMHPTDGYEIVIEYVGFAEAWEAYEEGKEVKSNSSNWHKRWEHEDTSVLLSDIRGKWLILEDK